MQIVLPTKIEVEINDVDLLTILKNKRDDILEGAEYAEPEDENGECWLWRKVPGSGEHVEKWKTISLLKYEFLDSLTSTIYHLQKELQSRRPLHRN